MFGPRLTRGNPPGRSCCAASRDGGGTLYDLEYLTDETGPPRVAAFGYWAGYAGAASVAFGLDGAKGGPGNRGTSRTRDRRRIPA